MKAIRILVALSVLVGSAAVWADRPHHWRHPRTTVEFGFVFGSPFYPYPYPHLVFWPPLVVPAPVVVQPPPVYIEQPRPPVIETLEPGYWYWCAETQAYYPDVKSCAGGWQKIAPRPAQ